MALAEGEVGEPATGVGPSRFRAFVSYSHADVAIARKLQRQLEAYRVPRRLADQVTPLGPARDRFGPVFRDQADLSASADLSAAVREAIAGARTLIVVCTPEAVRSQWVAREIALFRELHPGRPVLAALFEGEPAEAFPAALSTAGAEPLAADFRRSGDGPRLALLKVVAGALEVPLDELIQRDAQRRQRRVTAVTVAALALALVFATMTVIAIQARREAERQRADAEGLVEYMLTDLRERLKAVGRIDVMSDVNRRAMRYYARQGSPASLPDESLERRARVIGAMGEDAELGGNLELAQSRYEALHGTTAALLVKDPDDPARTLAHARSENRLALLALTRDRSDEALARFERTKALLGKIAAWGRNRPEWLRLSAFGHGNACATRLKRGERGKIVLADCERAVADAERLAALRPDDGEASYDLVFHYLWLAEAQLDAGQRGEARQTQTRYLALMRRMIARDSDNMLWREQEMELYVRHAQLLRAAGDEYAAQSFLKEAQAVNARLIARDPANALWSRYAKTIAGMMREGEG